VRSRVSSGLGSVPAAATWLTKAAKMPARRSGGISLSSMGRLSLHTDRRRLQVLPDFAGKRRKLCGQVARAIWTGVISFGLVTIPVRLVTAVRERDVRFHQFHRSDGGTIAYRRVCEKEDREGRQEERCRGEGECGGECVVGSGR